ncbi:2461_t:CDS:2, partial [Acaulospora morrowiae]
RQQSRNFVAASNHRESDHDNIGPGVGSSGTSFTAGSDTGREPPKCKCNLYATLKKKVTPGENQGREYYSCHKAGKGNCHFFQWADESSSQGNFNQSGFRRASESIGENSGNGNACFNCGESGHFSNACRKPKKAKSGSTDVTCFKCQRPGHLAPQCPSGSTVQRGRRGSGTRARGT